MSEEKTYRVIQGAVRMPRNAKKEGTFVLRRADMVVQGELLPPGVFTQADILSWLAEGRIEEAGAPVAEAEEQERIRNANPFRCDPSTLLGKTIDELLMMIYEIDDEYDLSAIETEQDAVRLLTSGWDPKYMQTVAPVNDRSRPENLALHKLEQDEDGNRAVKTDTTALSAEAQANLASAKERAQAPKEEE